ncbi:MAG: hypothetical protein D6762_07225 [Candidatus Neomarinimicrobiota bacterium]|nr:MAG: hypothetical protein D6762_07225 [Candidatus Neomarinimicrobiota bacterium]
MPFRSKLLLTVLCGSVALAVGPQFLAVPTSTEVLALGRTPVAGESGETNPALIPGDGQAPTVLLSSGTWLAGVRTSRLALGFSRTPTAWLTQIRTVSLDRLELRTERPTDQPIARYGAYGLEVRETWSRRTGPWSWGATLSAIWMQLYEASSTGAALDLGITHDFSSNLTWGLSLLHVGRAAPLGRSELALPTEGLVGLGYRWPSQSIQNRVLVGLGWISQPGQLTVSLGNDLHWKALHLYLGSQASPEVASVSGGFRYDTGRFSLRYAFQVGSQGLGVPQYIELSTRLP